MKRLKKILISLIVLTSCNVNAAFILNNDNNNVINVFNISESFESFYGYNESVRASSSTGYEQVNTAVFLLAEYQGQYSLISTFGSFVANGDPEGGSLKLELTNNGFGSFLFVDDPNELVNTSGNVSSVSFSYFADRTDGFIFGLGDGSNVDLSILMSDLTGIDNFVFLNSGGSTYGITPQFTLSLSSENPVDGPVSVAEPNGLKILLLSLIIGLSIRKRRISRQL